MENTPQSSIEPKIAYAERMHDDHRGRTARTEEFAIKSGDSAVKSAILLNGGAVVALMTFLGAVLGKGDTEIPKATINGNLKLVVALYSFGIVAAALTYCISWIVNMRIYAMLRDATLSFEFPYVDTNSNTKRHARQAVAFSWIAFALIAISYVSFVCGTFKAVDLLSSLVPTHMNRSDHSAQKPPP